MVDYVALLHGFGPLKLLAQGQSNIPATVGWGSSAALIMIVCNLLAIAVVRFRLPIPAQGGSSSSSNPTNLGVIQVVTGASIGHIIGVGVILGLANLGIL